MTVTAPDTAEIYSIVMCPNSTDQLIIVLRAVLRYAALCWQCWTPELCLLRARSPLGTSLRDPACLQRDPGLRRGYLSPLPSNVLHNHNMVIVRYCDGGSWAGSATAVVNVSADIGDELPCVCVRVCACVCVFAG